MNNHARRIACFLLTYLILGACGLSVDNHPRDIDPAKQDLLQSPTTTVATQNNSNP